MEPLLHAGRARRANPGYLHFLDVFKGVAAQLIVLHHLAFYGPMSDYVRPAAPLLMSWLELNARMAVQVFLVISGFLAARSLSADGIARRPAGLRRRIARRYLMLTPPFMVAMLLTMGASVWSAAWMTHDSISPLPTLSQLAAHALLLHGVLGYESISAGAWYVAIDFQLYVLLALLLWACGRVAAERPRTMAWLLPATVTTGVAVSLFWFNRSEQFDAWGWYFFGSYGLGALACWASTPTASDTRRRLLLLAMLLPATAALAFDFRSRIALALLLAGFIAWAVGSGVVGRYAAVKPLIWLGRISYSVFLVHFPVCLVINAAFVHFAPLTVGWQGAGMVAAWLASVGAGGAFHRLVEAPLARWMAPGRTVPVREPCANVLPSV